MNVPGLPRRLRPRRARPPYRRREASPHGAERRTTIVGDLRIHWLDAGEGDECVTLVHGLSGSSRWWERNLAALADRYRVLVPDLIGFGRTVARGRLPDMDEAARLLSEWLIEIGVRRTHLVGHSMGGQIAVHLAARFPERVDRLVLVDAAGIPVPLHPRELARSALGMAPLRHWGDVRFLPVILRDALTAGPRHLLQATRHILHDDVRPLLGAIRAPTLVVWGEWDTLVPLAHAARFRALIPEARLAVLPRAAHNPMVDRPAAFNRLLLRFLDGEEVGR